LPLTSDVKRFLVIETDADIATGAEFLVAREPCFAKVVDVHGLPSSRRVENNLASLLKIVTEQLISLKAADAIWRRIETRLHPFEPHEILKFSVEDLQGLGLTRAKARSFHAIAMAIHSGELNFDSLHQVPDHDVLAKLLALPGIGPWTAGIYLLTALGPGRCLPRRGFGPADGSAGFVRHGQQAHPQGVSRKGRELEAVALGRGTAAVEPLPGFKGPFPTG
jgi:DNA-3-methyladenine glycosylase II